MSERAEITLPYGCKIAFLVRQKDIFIIFGGEIIAKFIHNTENFYNFAIGNRRLYG